MVNLKYMDISEPAGYDVESVVETVAQYADLPEETYVTTPLEKPRKNPNIIVIMNEAFSDLSVIHEFGVTKRLHAFYPLFKRPRKHCQREPLCLRSGRQHRQHGV